MAIKKNMSLPIIITSIAIIIIIGLFANIKQTNVVCTKTKMDEFGIRIQEKLTTTLDGKKNTAMSLVKTIILPEKYLTEDDKYLEKIEAKIKKSYEYLGKGKVKISRLTDRLIVYVDVDTDETLILNNIKFNNKNTLDIEINSNTKSSDVVTLKINDSYTEGKLINHLRKNGYTCK